MLQCTGKTLLPPCAVAVIGPGLKCLPFSQGACTPGLSERRKGQTKQRQRHPRRCQSVSYAATRPCVQHPLRSSLNLLPRSTVVYNNSPSPLLFLFSLPSLVVTLSLQHPPTHLSAHSLPQSNSSPAPPWCHFPHATQVPSTSAERQHSNPPPPPPSPSPSPSPSPNLSTLGSGYHHLMCKAMLIEH